MSYDLLNNYLHPYLYPATRQVLLSRIICIWISSKFYYPELSVSSYPANFTIRVSLPVFYIFLQTNTHQIPLRLTKCRPSEILSCSADSPNSPMPGNKYGRHCVSVRCRKMGSEKCYSFSAVC